MVVEKNLPSSKKSPVERFRANKNIYFQNGFLQSSRKKIWILKISRIFFGFLNISRKKIWIFEHFEKTKIWIFGNFREKKLFGFLKIEKKKCIFLLFFYMSRDQKYQVTAGFNVLKKNFCHIFFSE